MYTVIVFRARNKLSAQFIDQALISGEFLEYDRNLGTYKSDLIDQGLFQLKQNIENLKTAFEASPQLLSAFYAKYHELAHLDGEVSVENMDLLAPLGIADLEENVVNLSIGLIRALNGDLSRLQTLKLSSLSPLAAEAEKIRGERPTVDEIAEWIEKL